MDWYRLNIIAKSQQKLYLERHIHIKEYNSLIPGLTQTEYYSWESAKVVQIHIKEFNSVVSGLIQTEYYYWSDKRDRERVVSVWIPLRLQKVIPWIGTDLSELDGVRHLLHTFIEEKRRNIMLFFYQAKCLILTITPFPQLHKYAKHFYRNCLSNENNQF